MEVQGLKLCPVQDYRKHCLKIIWLLFLACHAKLRIKPKDQAWSINELVKPVVSGLVLLFALCLEGTDVLRVDREMPWVGSGQRHKAIG